MDIDSAKFILGSYFIKVVAFLTTVEIPSYRSLEGRQIERISTIFDPEYAEQEAVHSKQHCAPTEHRYLLCLCIFHSRNLQRQRYGSECKDTVWVEHVSRDLPIELKETYT